MSGKQIFTLSLVGSLVVLVLGALLARPTQLYIVSTGRDFCGQDREGGKQVPTGVSSKNNRRTSNKQ